MRFWHAIAVIAGLSCALIAARSLEPDWITSVDQRAIEFATLPCVGIQSTSSGVVIDDQTVVTVAHALFESRDFAMRDHRGEWHRGEIVRLDLERDLAVVHVEDLRAFPLSVAQSRDLDAWPGTPVRMLDSAATGAAQAEIVRRVRVRTEVIGDRSQDSLRAGYEVALDIGPGDSGAALVDRDSGLVGIVFARSERRDAVAWATAAEEIERDAEPLPSWECDPNVVAELDLRPPRQERLAG